MQRPAEKNVHAQEQDGAVDDIQQQQDGVAEEELPGPGLLRTEQRMRVARPGATRGEKPHARAYSPARRASAARTLPPDSSGTERAA